MITTKKIKVDLDSKPRVHELPVIDAVQGDKARSVEISLYSGSSAWKVPDGTSIHVRFRKPDGTGGSYDTLSDGKPAAVIYGSTVTVQLAPEMMTVSGVTQMQVVLLNGDSALATFTVLLSVEPDPSLDTLDSKDFVNHISFIQQEMDRLYDETTGDGGYINQKVDDLCGRVHTTFESGAFNTATGGEIPHSYRVRSDFIPCSGRQITVVVPEGASVQCFFYDKNYNYTRKSASYATSFSVYTDAYVRCEVAFSDDTTTIAMASLADKLGIFFHSDAHAAFQGSIRMLGLGSFAECIREGYYQFDIGDLTAITDAPELSSGGILEVHSHAEMDMPMQTIRTTDGDIWFRWGTLPFQRFFPQKQELKWIALGDGITQGYYSDAEGAKLDADNGWAALAAKYNGWDLTNYAVAGSGYVSQGEDEDMLDASGLVDTIDFSQADLVTLAFGINDWMNSETLGSMDTNSGTVYSNMRHCIEKILSDNPCAKIVVISPINCCAYGNQETNWSIGHTLPYSGTLEDIFNAQREVCAYYGIELIDLLHGSVINRLNAPNLLPDGVHPSLECHKQLALELSRKLMGVNPASAVSDADRQEIAEEIKESLETIPAYVAAEAERVAENVLSVRTGQSFVFAALSDAHLAGNAESATSTIHAGAGLTHIRQITNLDMVAHLGDYINGSSDSTKAGSKEEYRAYHKAMAEGCIGIPTVWVEGNHDANYQGGDALTPDELYAHIGANNQGDHVVEYGNETGLYGYMDFPAKRLRVIYLNTSDGWKTGVSDTQAAWLCTTALDLSSKSDEASWGIIILMHIPVTFGDNAKLLSAIRNRNTKAELIAIFHGHCHNFRTEKVDGIWQIGISELCVGRNNEYGSAGMDDEYGAIFGEFDANGNPVYYPKIPDTAEDTSFNVVTIDRSSKTIYCHCFGAGYDRILSYVGANAPATYTVTNKLTNVVNSNASTTVQENGSYTTTLMATDGYILNSVMITMGGTDVTAAAYADGMVTIPAVTGNIVITAIAAEAASGYTNLFVESDVQTATRFNSGGEIVEGNFWCMSTYLACSEGDVIRVHCPNGLWTDHVQRAICTYNSSKVHVSNDIYAADCEKSSDDHTISATIPAGVAYVRISGLPHNDYTGTVITINELI